MKEHLYDRESPEVYYAAQRIPSIGKRDIDFLKARAKENPRLRCRLCLHASLQDPLHEMIIVFHADTYFRPLRHVERPQSFQVLEGSIRLPILDNEGTIVQVIDLAADGPIFQTRLPPGVWYSFIFRSEWLVIRETTIGPMSYTEREYAPFAPEEGDVAARLYASELRERVEHFSAAEDS